MSRPAFATSRVKCGNKQCADFDRDRIIEIPNLGESVFLLPTVPGPGPFGPMLNLRCGTCCTDNMRWAA
jgi:hypothetical protein